MKKFRLKEIVKEEIKNIIVEETLSRLIVEKLDVDDYKEIKDLIRAEVAAIMFDLFKKKSMWM